MKKVLIAFCGVIILTVCCYFILANNNTQEIKIFDEKVTSYSDNSELLYIYDITVLSTKINLNWVNGLLGVNGVMQLNDSIIYSKHIYTEKNEFMYTLYDYNKKNILNSKVKSFWYSDKWYTSEDFQNIENGSSYNDVYSIDKSIESRFGDATYHLCVSGYVKLTWSDNEIIKNPVVIEKENIEDELISQLYLNDIDKL